ncbi:MAG: hypothetical protein CK544_02230 [Planctomycetaceae bacterium]|nr:MAG: hypothetical protein CK544_02230 [Planctomycetaceae bacterium]
MRLDRTLLCVVCAVVSVNPCYAERRNDDGNDGTRDDSLWSETESRDSSRSGKSKCGISESAGKIRVDSKKGKGGSAAYQSTWDVDWTDSFVIEFEHELKSGRPGKTSQSATSGMALGFGTFNAASGYLDGVNLVVTRTKYERTLTASVRVAGVVVDSATANLATGAHDLKLVWTSFGGAVSLDVQLDGSTTPRVSLTGLETRFAGHEAEGMGVSLFGTSAGNFKFEASFDDVSFSGDDYNDSDDSGFDDDDGADDADEDGDRDGDDSASAATFNFALDAIIASNNLPLLEAESDVESGILVVKALQWNAADDKLVEVVANATTGAIVGTPRSWTPTASQRDKYEDSISVINLVVLSAQDAVSQALVSNPGATVHAVELEEESGAPVWEVEIVTASGVELKVPIAAD